MNIARDQLFLHGYFASPETVQSPVPQASRVAGPASAHTPVAAPTAPPAATGTFREAVARACRVPALQWRLSPPRLFDGLPGWAAPTSADERRTDFGRRYGNRVASLDWFGGACEARTPPAACGCG